MANYFLCLVIQRLVLPLILATCLLMRPVGLAIPYLIFLLVLPHVPVANKKTILGPTGLFMKLLIMVTILVLATVITFQLIVIGFPGSTVASCELGEIVLRHIGIVSFTGLGAWMVVYWLAPEVILFIGAVVVHIALRKLTGVIVPRRRRGRANANATADETEQGTVSSSVQESVSAAPEEEPQRSLISPERLPFFTKLGVLLSMCMLCVTGILQPSALSSVYFLVFLGAASWWACYKQLDRAFGVVLKITLVFLVIHIVLFLSYQTPWPQEALPFNDTAARVLALKPILYSSCDLNGTDIRDVHFNSDLDTDVYLNPIFLFLCYYCITLTSSLLLRTRSDAEKDKKRLDLSSQLENGIRLQNQISFRMQRKNILRKTLTSDRWRGAARKVKDQMHYGPSARGYYTYGRSTTYGTAGSTILVNCDVPDERTPLMRRGTHRIRDASATDGKENAQTDQIALENLATHTTISEEEEPSSFFEQTLLAIRNVATYIYKNSYIFTNVIMMVWSIMYHSWLTFVLLIWANLIWILPNHRKNMLNSSPFLVIYAELLLLAQYLYGMNLTEDELPTVFEGSGINLEEVGFVRRLEHPCVPLLVKSLFTTMFWISLRQLIQEKHTERRESMIANMAAPLQLPVGAATTAATGPPSALDRSQEKRSSAIVNRMAKFFKSFMIKFWIWVVALTLFLSAIIGNRMTVFRIVYMVLFLCFVLTFQFSFRVWRRIMWVFWVTVIVYSMVILVLVYLHQFEQFPRYWAAIGISKELQEDIGLEIFKTGQLFLHLVNPTLVVIITVIQLHYCHERFLIISEIPSVPTEQESEEDPVTSIGGTTGYGTFPDKETKADAESISETSPATTVQEQTPKHEPIAAPKPSDVDDDQSEKMEDFRFRKLSRQEINSYARSAWRKTLQLVELTWLFFELHMLKIVLIVAFSLSVNSVNFLHLLYVVLSVFTVKAHTTRKHTVMHARLVKITRIMSLFSAIMLILTMIYQVKYIKEENFQSNCTDRIDPETNRMDMNNAKWFGMRKAGTGQTLSDLLRPYLVYIIIVTVHAVTILRQTIHRIRLGQSPKTPALMFPEVGRADADKNIPKMIMYLFNYGFYKFGVEITLVALIVVIGNRMDLLSIFYAAWLGVMFHMTREGLQRFWKWLTWFIVIGLPIQYILFVGLPPFACVQYPWVIERLDNFRIWAMLPENTAEFRAVANKMVSDFVLLMFLCRQTVVFRLESNPPAGFAGGSNGSVLEDFKKLDDGNFQNPTPDFITKVRNWLDVLKRGLFLVFFWLTLAVVFLSGSSRVNLFSIGYLIGAFFFLWQGTDFYLHSIEYILKRWNILICYNVFVIGAKAFLQMFGCLFLDQLMNNSCWVMQLFGITCLSTTLPSPPPGGEAGDQLCNPPDPSDAGLFWDGVCFAFLLLQRRLFSSHYFCHIINESKASKYLASRGAELIEELRIKESTLEAERERQILEKIKAKMDRIKATQQKILEAVQDPATHAIDAERRQLQATHSLSSYTGYHTPIEDEIAGNSMFIEGEGLSEMPSDNGGLTVGRGSYQTQVPSPSSALMTVSLDAYLDPQRMSFDSPNDLMARVCSPDDTFPVFSPPPFERDQPPPLYTNVPPVVPTVTTNTLMPPAKPALQSRQHRRQSSLNAVSWPANHELTISPKVQHRALPASYMQFEDAAANGRENEQPHSPRSPRSPRSTTFAPNQPRHQRLSSMGSGSGMPDELTGGEALGGARRRSSFLVSLFVDDDTRYDEVTTTANGGPTTSRRRSRSRSYWGPVGEAGLRDSIRSARSRSPVSHHEYTVDHRSSLKRKISEHRPTAIRSGDYYMFEEVEQEFELEMIEPGDYEDDLEETTPKARRLSQRLTLGRLAAQLRKQKQREAYEIAYGKRAGNEDEDTTEAELAPSVLPADDGFERSQRRRLSSPILTRRGLVVREGGQLATAGPDDNVPERSAISDPLPTGHAHSGPRLRKPTTALDEPDDQQAGPSKQQGHGRDSISDEEVRLLSDEDDEVEGKKTPPTEEKKSKFSLAGLALIPAFLAGAVGSVTLRLHRASRNYRYVMRVLTREKQVLKETPGFGVGIRDKDGVWTHYIPRSGRSSSATTPRQSGAPSPDACSSSQSLFRPDSPLPISRHVHSSDANLHTDQPEPEPDTVPSSPAITATDTTQPNTTVAAISEPKPNTLRDSQDCSALALQDDQGLHTVSGLGAALAMISRKDPLKDERSTSLLPEILISAPSPERGLYEDGIPYRYYSNDTLDSKTDASSTDAIKRTLDEVSSEEDFTSRKHSLIVELLQAAWYAIMSHTDFICFFVVFLNQVNSASLLSLPLPLMALLWGTLTFPRPTQTFWTMLIAYTQMVVLIKCIGQFEMFWWNQTPIASNQPFHVARLFGIERKDGYATYDLILLLMLYCHRFILKSLGLWKADPTEEPALTEGVYQVDPNDEHVKALMASADEKEKRQETLEIRQPGEITGLSMVKINEKTGTIVEEQTDRTVSPDEANQLCVSVQPESKQRYFVQIAKESILRYSSSLKAFFVQLLDRQSRKTADVYGYMFLCDFINFFVILFGFSSFGTQEGDGGVLSYFEENRVPITFLLMLIIQFFLIVVDRALYLRKNITGKILFQFFLIIGLHVWMFFVLPATTERSFNATTPPILYYMIKCFYLLFSAYQIRCGYPARILGNFLTKGFSMANFSGFKLFMTVPFLFELRTLMDWIWTDTSMTLFDWLKMEDIFSNVYQLKCMRQLEEDLPAPRGQKKGLMPKYLMGGGMMLGIIFLIWFPLALFAFSNAVGEPNIPFDVSVTLRIGPYEPVYTMSAQNNNIHGLTEGNWNNFTAPYASERTAMTFLSNYEPADVAAVKLGISSTSIWNISPPDRQRLVDDLKAGTNLTCRFRYTVGRVSNSKETPGAVSAEQEYELGLGPARDALITMLADNDLSVSSTLPFLMPKFLRVQNSGSVRPIHQLVKTANTDTDLENFRNLTLRRRGENTLSWWEVREDYNDTLYEKYFSRLPYADRDYLVIYTFNDKIFPSTISSIAAGGIIGIYSTLILVFSRMLRTSIFSGASSKIMFEDLPYVDRVVQLCLDIYLVRESCEFTLEEDLFAKLLFLYRSPETMIKWTRPKNEPGGDDETDTMADVEHPKQE